VRGIMATNLYTKLASITDGLSNTIMIAEQAGRPGRFVSGRMTEKYAGGTNPYMNGPWAHSGNDIAVDGAIMNMVNGVPTASTLNTVSPNGSLCAINCFNQGEIYAFHTGGSQVVLGDSSTQFISTGIELRVLQLMCARADGMVVNIVE